MIYAFLVTMHDDPATWHTSIQFALCIIVYSLLQFIAVGCAPPPHAPQP